MTKPSRTLAATLMLALALSSGGFSAAHADDASAAAAVTEANSTAQDAVTAASPDAADIVDATDTANTADTPETSAAPDADLAASSTPDQPDQPAAADISDASSTPAASSTPDFPFDSVSALLTGSSTASSTWSIGDLASTPGSSTPATTTTATSTGPTIQSGESVALANILNIVNTNLVNSSGNALLLNYVDPVTGPIDLRTGTPVFASSSPICALIACAGTGGVSVNLSSDAGIHNAVVLNATSGGNLIDMGSTTGQAAIGTGNAYAGLNLINLANTNIVDSNYLLVTMNAFQGVSGDIIFPSLSNLLSSLAHNLSADSVSMTSDAVIDNTVSTDAQTGGNSTQNASSSMISTGTANSSGSVFNQINTNMLGGSTVAILFRVQGTWAGKVFGAPEGLQWTQGSDGSIALFDASSGSGSGGASLAQLTASSTARIDNDVSVVALTGDNLIKNAQSALITTGNALASANVMNVANTNVVGKNWIMAIINIFGDFTGNISFGRPDLWVGEQVSVPSFIDNGSQATYKFTIINNGDAPATNVQLTDTFDRDHIQIASASASYTTNGDGDHVWSLGTIPAGGAVEVTYHGTVQNTSPGTDVTDTVKIAGEEPDNNLADNTDTATFTTSVRSSGSSHHRPRDTESTDTGAAQTAHITVTRAVPNAASQNGAAVHQQVTVTNDSGTASIPLVVHDVLTAPDGSQVYDQAWSIGSLVGGDAVQLAYDANFGPNAPAGTYTLSTLIKDEQGNELGWFVGNGTIVLTSTTQASRLLAPLGTFAAMRSSGDDGNVLDSVLPGVAIAHAAGTGDQAAAAGLASLSWPYLLAILLVLLGLLALLALYRRREQFRQ